MPAVYVVGDDGSEQIVNRTIDPNSPDTIIIQRLARKFVFRMGKAVGCLVNKAYDPKGITDFNGTVAPGVERVIKGARP